MKYLMEIADIVDIPGKGKALVGVNPDLDYLSIDQIRDRIRNKVFIQCDQDVYPHQVIDIGSSTSLIEKKNIWVLVSDLEPNIGVGCLVYTGV